MQSERLTPINRREFLKKTRLAAVSLSADPGLIVPNTSPVELETPVSLLHEHRYTPRNIMYIRNDLGVPLGMQPITEVKVQRAESFRTPQVNAERAKLGMK